MKNVASHEGVKSENQLLAEIDRLSAEIREMLDGCLRRMEESKEIERRNDLLFADLERQIECWKK